MDAEGPRVVTRLFDDVKDPHIERTRRHKHEDILMIALVAILGGAEAWTDVEMFGHAKKDWFARFLELPNDIPSHDTFGRLFARLDPEELNRSFARWIKHLAAWANIKTIAIDGKTLRRSADLANDQIVLHLLSAGPMNTASCWPNSPVTTRATRSPPSAI